MTAPAFCVDSSETFVLEAVHKNAFLGFRFPKAAQLLHEGARLPAFLPPEALDAVVLRLNAALRPASFKWLLVFFILSLIDILNFCATLLLVLGALVLVLLPGFGAPALQTLAVYAPYVWLLFGLFLPTDYELCYACEYSAHLEKTLEQLASMHPHLQTRIEYVLTPRRCAPQFRVLFCRRPQHRESSAAEPEEGDARPLLPVYPASR